MSLKNLTSVEENLTERDLPGRFSLTDWLAAEQGLGFNYQTYIIVLHR